MTEKEVNPKGVREQLKSIWENFLLDTSLHGCNCIAKNRNHVVKRWFWILALLSTSAVLIYYVVDFYNVYQTHPYITKTSIQRLKSLPLPAVSICNPGIRRDKIRNVENMIENLLSQDDLVRAHGSFNFTTMNVTDLEQLYALPYKDIGMSIEDLIIKATVNARFINVDKEFESRTIGMAHCFTFNGENGNGTGGDIQLTQEDSLQMIFNISQDSYLTMTSGAGVTLIFHEPSGFLSDGVQVFLSPGYFSTVALTVTKMTFLPKPFRSLGDEYCLESTGKINLERHRKYTWAGCMMECVYIAAAKTCNCSPVIGGKRVVPSSIADKECDNDGMLRCVIPAMDKTLRYITNGNMTTCDCPRLCRYTKYDVRTSSMAYPHKMTSDFLYQQGAVPTTQHIRDNYLAVNIRFESMIMNYVEHVPELSIGDIQGKLGGQMGLFLGASLLTLWELINPIIGTVVVVTKALLRLR